MASKGFAVKDKGIDPCFDSIAYKNKLENEFISLSSKISISKNEATLASSFENSINSLISSIFGFDVVFNKEEGASYKFKFSGRMDAVVNNLVIEYKHHSNFNTQSKKKKAISQLNDYLNQLKDNKIICRGILTDGVEIQYSYFDDSSKKFINTPIKSFEKKDFELIIKGIIYSYYKSFDATNIVDDFVITNNDSITVELCRCLMKMVNKDTSIKTEMLFREWEVLFHLSENDEGQSDDIRKRREDLSAIFDLSIDNTESEHRALYSLQTSYAIIVKLIAIKSLSKIDDSNIQYFSDLTKVTSEDLRNFMEILEDGYFFNLRGVKNLLEGDFFFWYTDKVNWNTKLYDIIKRIVSMLDCYYNFSFDYEYKPIDIFKDLYMGIMPNSVRHSLGEYFTPAWIADYVVEKGLSMLDNSTKEDWKAIDPCCGSGIFIITLIKKILKHRNIGLSETDKANLLEEITSRVIGIDLNPISVLTSRVSYFLSIITLLNNRSNIIIPIYLGDSARIPQIKRINEIDCFSYTVNTIKGNIDISLPVEFVNEETFYDKMADLQTMVKTEDPSRLTRSFIEAMGSVFSDKLHTHIEDMSNRLIELHKNEWDGIWIRIISNFMLVAKINNIDLIVGNPPWVKWEHLPQNYANNIKELCINKSLFSGQYRMGAISLNICALIANVTATAWLKNDGILAFLMPKTMLTQDSFEGFRNFFIGNNDRLYLQQIDNWDGCGTPFVYTTEKFQTYYYSRQYVDYTKGVPVTSLHKGQTNIKELNSNIDFANVKDKIRIDNNFLAVQIDKRRTGYSMINKSDGYSYYNEIIGDCAYKARSGVEFTPKEVYMLKSKSTDEERLYYINQSDKTKYKVRAPKNGIRFSNDYMRPLILGPNISEFSYKMDNDYCFFPYEKCVENDKETIRLVDFERFDPILKKYLIDNKHIVSKQSKKSKSIAIGDDFYALSKVGLYTFSNTLVAFRDNVKMCATVIHSENEKLMPICAKHAPYISMDKTNRLISYDEAYYICGILNTSIVQKYFKATYSNRSFSIDLKIKMPLYDANNRLHAEISKLAKQASIDYNSKIANQIELCYIKLCKSIEI